MRLESYNGRSDKFSRLIINSSDRIKTLEFYEHSTDLITGDFVGTIRHLALRPGLSIEIFDQLHHAEFIKDMHTTYPAFRFAFNLTATGRVKRKSSVNTKTDHSYPMESGYCTVAFFPEFEGRIRIKEKSHFLQVVVHIAPSILSAFINKDHSTLPADLRVITENGGNSSCYHIGRISASMNSALYEILNCHYSGTIRKIFMESKALELVAYKLAQISVSETGCHPPETVRRKENEQVHHARELLFHNMEDPPTLFDLARKVGLSHTKLNAGFRKIYGTTVFGYLQKTRLERAKYLMEKEAVNVTEAAFSVGYNSIPSFSRAFSQLFDQSPKNVLKNKKKN